MEDIENIEFSVSNINIDFSKINIKKTYSIPLSGTWYNIAISSTGKYQIAIQNSLYGQIFISHDFGLTWKLISTKIIGNFYGVALSFDGKYQTVFQNGLGILVSNEYGERFKEITVCANKDINGNLIIFNTNKYWVSGSMSGTGQYQTCISENDAPDKGGSIYISNNYGQSWIDVTPIENSEFPGFYYCISISYSGKIQLIIITSYGISTGEVYLSSYLISTDYGLTWTIPVLLGLNLVACVTNKSIDESIDGKYQYVIDQYGNGIYGSNDFGETWNLVYPSNFGWINICISSSGQYVYTTTIDNFIGVSNDYGNTWRLVYFDYNLTGISTSSDGSIVTVTSNIYKIFISNDYGNTFNTNNNSPSYININDVKISTNGNIQAVSITNDNILVSSNYGNEKTWGKVDKIRQWSQNAMSLTGEYQTVCELNGYCYTSNDYGETWIPGANLKFSNISGIAMSGNGKYQVITNGSFIDPSTPCVYISDNYGLNWNSKIISSVTQLSGAAMSLTGKYIGIIDFYGHDSIGGYAYISNDYGMNFRKIDITGRSNLYSIAISSSGQYQLCAQLLGTPNYFLSNNYGETWSKNIIPNITGLESYTKYAPTKCIISSTGEFQFINLKLNKNIIIYSKNYGSNWKILDTSSINNSTGISSISSNGQYIVLSNENSIYELYLNTLIQ